MTQPILGLFLAAAALLASQQPASVSSSRDARTQEIYVSVLDSKDAPITGLTAADFAVKEDGVTREVLKAGPATAPMQIVVIVDDSQAATQAIQPMREALTGFVEALQGKAEIGLVTVGERPESLVASTTDAAALKKGIGRIFARPGSGAYLLDGLVDVSKGLERRKAARPVIVAISMEGVEYSNLQYQTVLEQLDASGAALHVLAVGSPVTSLADELRNRGMAIAEGTKRTGGRRDQLLAVSSIPDAMKRLGAELLNQYVVTYSRPEALISPERVQVSVNRPGATVRARNRAAGK